VTDDLEGMGCEHVVVERGYVKTVSSNVKRFEQILCRAFEHYSRDCVVTDWRKFKPSRPGAVIDAHQAVLRVQPNTNQLGIVGKILSSVYRLSLDSVITYDLPIPVRGLGSSLREDQVLVNCGTVGSFGSNVKGIIVNSGTVIGGEIHVQDLDAFVINRSPTPLNIALQYGDGLYVDTHRRAVHCGIPKGLSLNEFDRGLSGIIFQKGMFSSEGSQKDTVPDSELVISVKNSHRYSFHKRENATKNFSDWIDEIEHLAATQPLALLHRYACETRLYQDTSGYEYSLPIPPGIVARRELLNLLFEKRCIEVTR